MLNETVDLYEYFNIKRNGVKGGYLTVYVRTALDGRRMLRPAMLVAAGGGYEYLAEREGEPVAIEYMSRGFAAFSLKYSVNTQYPTPLIEACMAIAYIRANAEKYSVDVNHVAAAGFSAGGHLISMLATIWDEKEVSSVLGETVNSARPDAVVLSYPVVSMKSSLTHVGSRNVITGGDEELVERLSTENRVTPRSAPSFIWHTYEDDCVKMENSLALAAAYKKACVPFSLHIFEKGPHGLSLINRETNDMNDYEQSVASVGKWMELSADWLESRGFAVKTIG